MMQMIKGIDINLYVRKQTGIDEFNRPVYETFPETISNVLVGEPTTEDVANEMNLSGKRIAYVLAIPKGDIHDFKNAIVEFFGMKFRTIGVPTQGIEENIPLQWNKKVKVERYAAES